MIGDRESSFSRVGMPSERGKQRVLIDQDRRTAEKSYCAYTVGDTKVACGTTGVLADDASGTVYLSSDGTATGSNLFTVRPVVSVEYDGNGSSGGFVRGQGPEKPASSYVARNRADIWYDAKWVANANSRVFAVTVTNKSGSSADFVVTATGV